MTPDFAVTELPPTEHPQVGDQAPGFTRPLVSAEYWADTKLTDLATPTVLVFYPMDGSFPATYIWSELADREWEDTYDGTVVGCSIGTPYAQTRLIDQREMAYRLFSDPTNTVAEQYNVVHDLDGMAGVTEPRPAVFIIDNAQVIQYAWVATEWPEFPPYDEIAAAIESLQ